MSSRIASSVEEIQAIRFHPWPTRPIAMTKVVRVDATVMGVGRSGRVYVNGSLGMREYYVVGKWRWLDSVIMECLVRLELVSQAAVDDHVARVEARERRSNARTALDSTARASSRSSASPSRPASAGAWRASPTGQKRPVEPDSGP